jgi:homoserine O-succinyltransferase/O-acetyltransferase
MSVSLYQGHGNARGSRDNSIAIGIVNNMPDSALEATERQFLRLLNDALPDSAIRVQLFAIPGVPRGERGRERISRLYSGIEELRSSNLDALIVTGAEPRTADLRDEAYWPALTEIVDWAENHTISILLSCLAAHAAVLHLDGIRRALLPEKRFGLFEEVRLEDHALTRGLPAEVRFPHSRWNDLVAGDLDRSGYRLLTGSDRAGVDLFVKERKSLFVFFQGHPEYDSGSLQKEYRRDVARFLKGTRQSYPMLPLGCFNERERLELQSFETRARTHRRESMLAELPLPVTHDRESAWHPDAAIIYRNWVQFVISERAARKIGTLKRAG